MKTHEQDKKTSISTLETKHADALSKQVTAIEAIKKAHAEKTNLVEQLENEQKNLISKHQKELVEFSEKSKKWNSKCTHLVH